MNNKFTMLGIRKCSRPKSRGGFTIVELLLTFSIYAIIASIVIANYRDYSANAISAKAPEDIILALRQAQVYGAGGKENPAICETRNSAGDLISSSFFDCRYGVSFSAADATKKGFTVFVDVNDNKVYDGGDTIVETVTWKDPSLITAIECLRTSGVNVICAGGVLNVTFKRPSPDAIVNDVTPGAEFPFERGRITMSNGLAGPSEKIKIITISQAGQISLQ